MKSIVELLNESVGSEKEIIDTNLDRLHNKLNAYPKLPGGITPDEVKFSPEYKQAKKEWDFWFKKLQTYNKQQAAERKKNGTTKGQKIYGVYMTRMQELFFEKWISKNHKNIDNLSAEQKTELANKFLSEKFPQK